MKYLIIFIIAIAIVLLIPQKSEYQIKAQYSLVDERAKAKVNLAVMPVDRTFETVKTASNDWEAFIEAAKPIAAKYDIPLKVLVSQAALETGHGTSYLATTKNNWFGLGAYDDTTGFGYESMEASIEYYARLISQNALYSKAYAVRHDPYAMIKAIRAAGYATDPHYVDKVTNLAVWKNL